MALSTAEIRPVDVTQDPALPVARPSAGVIAVAWIATLLISRLPEIVLRDGLSLDVPWWPWVVLGIAAALWVLAGLATSLGPMRRYFAVMTGLAALLAVLPAIFDSAVWASIVPGTTNPVVALLAERTLLIALAPLIVGLVLLLGSHPRDAYVRLGNLRAPSRSLQGGGGMPWSRFGPMWVVFLVILTGWMSGPMLQGATGDVAAALPLLGLAAVAALLNATWEEVAFRAMPLSQLQRAVGPSTGVLIIAVWFGLGHYYGGIPSGPIGAIASGAIALLMGRAMIETRGLGWPLALHFSVDFVIYGFLALSVAA